MLLMLIPLLAMVAFAVDLGYAWRADAELQAAADAAALAGATDLFDNYWTNNGTDPGLTAWHCARDTAAANGFAHDGTTNVVTVNGPVYSISVNTTNAAQFFRLRKP